MPSISEFQKTEKSVRMAKPKTPQASSIKPETKAAKRRPGRSPGDMKTKIKVVEVEPMTEMNLETENSHSGNSSEAQGPQSSEATQAQVSINFPGSEVLRAKFPKSFKAAEGV